MNKIDWIIIHHTGGTDSDPMADSSNFVFEHCEDLHKKKFNFKSSLGYYCGYQYYINKNGTVKQARADTEEGAHTIGKNKSSIGICMSGNFDATDPTTEQVVALTLLLSRLKAKYGILQANIVPHRTFASKTCYGKRLPDNWAQNLVTINGMQRLVESLRLLLSKIK